MGKAEAREVWDSVVRLEQQILRLRLNDWPAFTIVSENVSLATAKIRTRPLQATKLCDSKQLHPRLMSEKWNSPEIRTGHVRFTRHPRMRLEPGDVSSWCWELKDQTET